MDRLSHFDHIADHPIAGVAFYDLHGLMRDPPVWRTALDELAGRAAEHRPTGIVAADPRGFLLAGYLGPRPQLPTVPCRKADKLPGPVERVAYATEHSRDRLEVRRGAAGRAGAAGGRCAGDRRHRVGDRRPGGRERGDDRGGRVPAGDRGAGATAGD